MVSVHVVSYIRAPSPIGELLVVARGGRLSGVHVADHPRAPRADPGWVEGGDTVEEARRQLGEYFAGTRTTFDLPLRAEGTDWQRKVWSALRMIPFGATRGYGELAAGLGSPGAARAVGRANGANPVTIVVPCHRVVAAGGLGGYGWGLGSKRWLLDHERAVAGLRAR